jgi:hypothetical protein
MASLLITLVVWCLILAIAWWVVSKLPIPEPFNWVVIVIFGLVAILMLLSLLPIGGGLRLPVWR